MDGESQQERDARIKALFDQLDTKKKGTLDLPALKNGLIRMNHRACRVGWAGNGAEDRPTDVPLQLSKMRTI